MSAAKVRVYGKLRTAHLERFAVMEPTVVLFSQLRYDFDLAAAPASIDLRRCSRLEVLRTLLREPFDVVELNEPLVSNRWLDLLLQVATVRVRGFVTRRRARIVSYCIRNADPALEVAARWRLPVPLGTFLSWLCVNLLARATDRLAFGTAGSYDMYSRYCSQAVLAGRMRMFEAVPAPCACLERDEAREASADVIFVGAFNEHKGVDQLMRAWDQVHADRPGLRLRLIGKGRLVETVAAWSMDRDDVRLDVDPPRAVIHAALRAADVLVLLSRRRGAWREQIGLPILEGLAHGCEIVTTDETGLADWLDRHGHRVLDAGSSPSETARAILATADLRRDRIELLAQLPVTDQRVAADAWLLRSD